MMNSTFYNMMFNQQYVNPDYYHQLQQQYQYKMEQDKKVLEAEKAMHDLCKAIRGMDDAHQQEAFYKCLAVLAAENMLF